MDEKLKTEMKKTSDVIMSGVIGGMACALIAAMVIFTLFTWIK